MCKKIIFLFIGYYISVYIKTVHRMCKVICWLKCLPVLLVYCLLYLKKSYLLAFPFISMTFETVFLSQSPELSIPCDQSIWIYRKIGYFMMPTKCTLNFIDYQRNLVPLIWSVFVFKSIGLQCCVLPKGQLEFNLLLKRSLLFVIIKGFWLVNFQCLVVPLSACWT